MNKTYNVVFNKSIGEYQVTSELTSNRKKTKSTKRILVTMASLLLTAAVNISNAQIKVDEGRTELHNASDISGDLSNVSFNIKDRDILSLDALKNAFKAYMADPHNEDYEKIDKSLHGYTTSIHESIEDESLGHLYMAKDMALTLSKTIHSDSDQNIVIRADKDHELKLSGATTTLFNNANTLIMSGKDSSLYPSSTMSIRDNKVVGNLIENSGDAYFDSIIFVNNRGEITNFGTMLFQSSSFGSNEGVLIDNHGDLVIKDSSFSNHQGVFFTTRGDTIIDSSVFERNNHDGAVKPSLNMIGIDGGTTIIRNSIFRDSNQAAISVDKPSILIVEHSLFENLRVDTNNAGALDGYVAKKLQVFDTTFKENHTSSHGGAVAFVAGDGSEDSRLFKNSDFIKNSAGEWGAAIYGYSDFTIAVDEGKRSTFSGNIAQDNGSGSGYEANSIASANNSVTLQVDGILDMRDPMYAFNTVKKLGLGRWMLGGNNRNITNLEVQEGELYLYREGETENANKYSDDSQVAAGNLTLSGDFTLGAVGKYATLSVNGNQIQANNISLNNSGIDGGTTLIFRIDGTTSLADSILMLAGNTQVDNLVTIDIDSYDLQDTTYQLVETTGQADLDLSQYQLTINGSSPLDGNRLENGFSLGYGSNKKIIELAASNLENVVNIWGDKAGNELDLWSQLHDKNWSHSTGEFLSGDIAVFNGNRAGTVRIADNIRSAAIIVNGTEDYALQGTIIIDEEKTTFKNSPNNYYNVLGKLIVGAQEGSPFSHHFSGVLDLTATKNNQFSNGIEIESGTLKVSALDQLGKNTLYLSFTGNSDGTLLVTDDADITIGNDHPLILNIEEGKSARIKTEKNAELTFNSFTLNAKTSLTLEGTKDHLIRFNDANMLIRDGELIADYVHFDNSFVQLYGIYETHLEPLDISIKNSLFENSYTGLWFNDLGDEHTANINIENTIFRKNSTGIENHYRGGISISGSTFIDNGTLNEPAGSVISSGAYLKLENSLIANNIGGYTLFLKDSANINNTRFEGNIVTSTSYGSGEGGGAIFVDHWNGEDSKAEVNLVETSFINNSSIVADEGLEEALIGNGGAISLKSGVINIDRGTFSDNTAARKGGAIVGADDPRFEHEKFDRTFNITNTTFTGNSAGIDGGAIYGVFKALNITDTDFENNIATTGKGGAINFGGTLNLGAKDQDVIFSGNTANGV